MSEASPIWSISDVCLSMVAHCDRETFCENRFSRSRVCRKPNADKSFDCCRNEPLKNRSVAWKTAERLRLRLLVLCEIIRIGPWSIWRRLVSSSSSRKKVASTVAYKRYKTEYKTVLFDQRNNLFGNNALYKAIFAYLILCSESRRLSVVNGYHDVEDEVSQRKQVGVGGPKSLFRVGKLTEVFFDIAASLTQDFKSQYWTGLCMYGYEANKRQLSIHK